MIEAEAVVLAAGAGARFGGGKLLAPYGQGVLLDGALDAAFAAPVGRVLVVTGADAPRVEAAARDHARRLGQEARLAFVHAERHGDGLSASLGAGIASLGPTTGCALVFLGDMPRVPAVASALIAAVADGAQAAAPVFDGRRGHPVAFSRALFAALAALAGDRGARRLLDGLGAGLALTPAPDAGVLFDVDTPGDLASAGDTAGEFAELPPSLRQGPR